MEKQAPNPWVKIPLSAYESHMRQASVGQLQAVNALMAAQFALGPARTAMVLGVAGDNGLEHAAGHDFRKVYGVDVNRDYLRTCEVRYPDLNGTLECICADLADAAVVLPRAELLIANLLIEYIGCECFRRIVRQVCPHCISCVIQVVAGAVRFRRSGSSASSGGRIRPGSRVTLRRLSADRPGRSAAAERKEIGAAGFCRDGCRGEWPPK